MSWYVMGLVSPGMAGGLVLISSMSSAAHLAAIITHPEMLAVARLLLPGSRDPEPSTPGRSLRGWP